MLSPVRFISDLETEVTIQAGEQW